MGLLSWLRGEQPKQTEVRQSREIVNELEGVPSRHDAALGEITVNELIAKLQAHVDASSNQHKKRMFGNKCVEDCEACWMEDSISDALSGLDVALGRTEDPFWRN